MNLDRMRERKVVFYGRVSSEHEAQLEALKNQMQWYDDILKYHANWTLVDKYIDEGITGTQAKKRPAFMKMMEDAKDGKFDLIVTREVCRFARNTVDTLVSTRDLKNYDVEVYFVEDNIWTMDGDGELRLTIMATLAQEESRKVSERVKAGQKISRDNGVLYGNGNILGYNRVGNTYEKDKEQAETVRLIFDLYLSGMGEKKIMGELIARQRKDAYGNVKWCCSKINRILRRATYAGFKVYNQSHINNYLEQKRINHKEEDFEMVRGDWEPIVTEAEFATVAQIRASKTLKMPSGMRRGKVEPKRIWQKKLRCSCGSTYKRNKWRTNKAKQEIVYGYQCYNVANNGNRKKKEKHGVPILESDCGMSGIAEWKLYHMSQYIINEIWTDRREAVLSALQMIADSYISDEAIDKEKIDSLKSKLDKLIMKRSNLIEMRAGDEISKSEYMHIRQKMDKQIEMFEDEIGGFSENQEEEQIDKVRKMHLIKEALDTIIEEIDSDEVIDQFIYKVVPHEDGTFEWYLKLGGDISEPSKLGIEGRKNKAEIIRYPLKQCDTGCT